MNQGGVFPPFFRCLEHIFNELLQEFYTETTEKDTNVRVFFSCFGLL